jgi:hypothetical protein
LDSEVLFSALYCVNSFNTFAKIGQLARASVGS